MNFDCISLLHKNTGFWRVPGGMVSIAAVLSLVFWRKRHIAHAAH